MTASQCSAKNQFGHYAYSPELASATQNPSRAYLIRMCNLFNEMSPLSADPKQRACPSQEQATGLLVLGHFRFCKGWGSPEMTESTALHFESVEALQGPGWWGQWICSTCMPTGSMPEHIIGTCASQRGLASSASGSGGVWTFGRPSQKSKKKKKEKSKQKRLKFEGNFTAAGSVGDAAGGIRSIIAAVFFTRSSL